MRQDTDMPRVLYVLCREDPHVYRGGVMIMVRTSIQLRDMLAQSPSTSDRMLSLYNFVMDDVDINWNFRESTTASCRIVEVS